MINFHSIEKSSMETQPFEWALIDGLFEPSDAEALVTSFPCDYFKTVKGYDGEKDYKYEARALIGMGGNAPLHVEKLSAAWRQLAIELVSSTYRSAMGRLIGRDLTIAPMEVNVFHYGASAGQGPHLDLKDKIVTHVLYFNKVWRKEDGGCLSILRSSDMFEEFASVLPIIGSSVVLLRSEKSWHSVSRVAKNCRFSRRSMTVTFYHPGSISTLWPPGDRAPVHRYDATNVQREADSGPGSWSWLHRKISSWRGFTGS